jgi:uncharacterized protein YdaU (DUF1376 family)
MVENKSGPTSRANGTPSLTTAAAEDRESMADDNDTTTLSKSPAFQFYPKDFLTDENVRVMSLQERGAYITLICLCWLEGTLPADVSRLARVCGTPLTVFRRLWPALSVCFRPAAQEGRLMHPRLERERDTQATFRRRQSDNGKRGADKRWHSEPIATPSPESSGATVSPMAKNSSSSPISNLQSPVSSLQDPPEGRSKRPMFKGQRFVVFEWMYDNLRQMLGPHFEAFDVHAWFYNLDAKAEAANLVVPQRDGGKWLMDQTLAEAIRRGLPVAASSQGGSSKTAGNAAALARFVSRGKTA